MSPEQPRTIYADIIGQLGTTTKQLFQSPPPGYRFVPRRKLTTAVADMTGHNSLVRVVKRRMHRYVPMNLLAASTIGRFLQPPPGTCLTYSESTVVFRNEPWIMWAEVGTQFAGYNQHSLRRFRRTVERALSSANCRGIICHSHAAKTSVLRHLDGANFQHKMQVLPPAWPVGAFHKPPPLPGQPVRILFVGGSTMSFGFSIKGGRECLEAFRQLRALHPGLELIVRCDVTPEIRRECENMPGLRLLSRSIPTEEMASLFRQADVYWYPAHCLMSVTMLEAMSYGLPIVTTDYYDNPEYVQHGCTGLIIPRHRNIPPWDTSEAEVRRALQTPDASFVRNLINATGTLIENAALRRTMGLAGREEIESRFSLAARNRRFSAFLDVAIAPLPAARTHPRVARTART